MIHLSTTAASEIGRLMSKQCHRHVRFRLQVQVGGCSGLIYKMTFDEEVEQGELVYDCNGISVVTDARSSNYIDGLTLDYSEDLMGGGFRFHNPNATQICGCGNSFSTRAFQEEL
jgi:iron-sulfur cluster assembly accessory protein